MERNLNWAVLGTGVIANEMAQALKAMGKTLYAVGNRTHEKAVTFAEKYQVAKVYDDFHEMFTDPDVDVIYITTPHNTHIGFVREALKNKKHVLCEKSITLNSLELEEALALAKENDVIFALPFIVLVIIFSLSVEEPARRLTQWVSGMTGWSVEMVSPMTGLIPLFIAIGALGWLTLARIVRTQTMELKGQEFVEAARSLGIGHMKILFRHIAPNLFGAVIVYTTLAVPGIMLLEAVLSFLGLGVKAPNSSWGTLIKEGADRMEVSPELLLFPALLFSATLLALNFLGDGLRDALDPKSSRD